MKQQDFDKQARRIEDFAELNEVPIDHFLYQQMAQAARSFREGDFERAQFQLDDALAAAQDFGTSPGDYLPHASISETITLTESQLRRTIRKTLREGTRGKQNLVESMVAGVTEGETNSLYIQHLVGPGDMVQITQLNDNEIIEFPVSEIKELIDVLYEIHEASRQMNSTR